MIFPGWQIGLDIQNEGVRAVAVQRCRYGWQLRHWGYLPLPAEVFTNNILSRPTVLFEVLDSWRKQLPHRHLLRVSFPAQRTLQRKIPAPDNAFCEAVHEEYIAYTAAQQLQMSASQLCCDYLEQEGVLNVTAARQSDINTLLSCLKTLRLFPQTITPCDKVLHALPTGCYPPECTYLIHEEFNYWLWASRRHPEISGWQDKQQSPDLAALSLWLKTPIDGMALSRASTEMACPQAVKELDVWQLLTRLYPPIPQEKGRYTLALGLALGGVH